MFDLIVKNGQVVTSQRIYKADICIKDGKISAIVAPESDLEANKVIDAGGKYIFPG
ncbi:MAG TPA: allantoinase AllB, partial [Tissierella sp.]|nr:allantoinase AllB [Tissierella sp.]